MRFESSIWLQAVSVICLMGMMVNPGCIEAPLALGDQALKELTITGPEKVGKGGTKYFGVEATYEDGSTAQTISDLTWTIKEGPGTINDLGFYCAPETVTEETPVTLEATLTRDGVTHKTTKVITLVPTVLDEPEETEEDQTPENSPPLPDQNDSDSSPADSWINPIGIPTPEFGLEQTNMIYADEVYDFGRGDQAYPDAGNGPYTHYVDNTSPNATDTDNEFGTKDRPRKTIPGDDLKAGSVVEIHGGPYDNGGPVLALCGAGTKTSPVIFRGPNSDHRPVLSQDVRVRGQYIIVENLKMSNCGLTTSSGISVGNACVRYCEFSGGGGNALYASSYNGDSISNIVFYKNLIHDKGNIHSSNDEDAGGIACTAGVSYCWIVDNEIFNTSGSGIQIVAESLSAMPTTNHIYVGRNLVYKTRQSGIWSKQSVDCVFSQNTVHSVINTSWSPSKGIGYQYGPERLWIINNHIYHCTFGVAAMSSSGLGNGTEAFILGNVIHDIHHANDGTKYFNPNSSWSNAGIMLVGVSKNYVVNNTICNADAGINSGCDGSLYIVNNIISNITEPDCQHIFLESAGALNNSVVSNNFFFQNGEDIRIRWGSSHLYTLPEFQAATGKGGNCVNSDPGFVDKSGGDLHLLNSSPAINQGLESDLYDRFQSIHGVDIRKDLEGTPRPTGGACDIGAYEFGQ
ncbi:MAG: right-handed parallel beta-helix repeat-containing protein [Phycisphaerae bacterium]|nr:right-handed parallel beta-helix repeat-containing protein [Phycisphaerae bacterium]